MAMISETDRAARTHRRELSREVSGKSVEAFRTISEVSTLLEVPQHVLRFWETKFAQLRPLKRGGGRRYYRPEDVDLLRTIQRLLHQDGYTIKGVQKWLKENKALPGDADVLDEVDEPEPELLAATEAAGAVELEPLLLELKAIRALLPD
jgi:DNA-binding transcriptional MerR regulator